MKEFQNQFTIINYKVCDWLDKFTNPGENTKRKRKSQTQTQQ